MQKTFLLFLLASFCLTLGTAQTSGKKDKHVLSGIESSSRNSSAFIYTLTVLNEAYEDLTGATSINNDELWDDPLYIVPIGFPFELNGHVLTAVQFYGVGALLAGQTSDPDVFTAVFPFEMDMVDRGQLSGVSASPLSYKLEGAPGSRILKVEWNNAGSYAELNLGSQDMFINVQLWLYEGSNQIDFRFGESLITDPGVFYAGGGTYMGLSDVNENLGELINPHFFSGDIAMPVLEASDVTIEGTPTEGTVYRLTLDIDLPLDITISSQNATSVCNPNGSATVQATGGEEPYTYAWSTGETTQTITGLDAGTYSVTVTDNAGETATAITEITNVNDIFVNASSTDETSTDADDGTATAAPSGGSESYTYLWSNGETTASIGDLPPGVYSVTVTDSEGCTAAESVTVNAFECLGLEIIELITNVSCFGTCDGSVSIVDVIGGTPPYTYLWSNGLSSAFASDLCAGEIIVTITDALGCEVSEIFEITGPAEFFANAGATSESGPGLNDGTAWAAPSGSNDPYTYEWSNGGTDSLITNLTPGVYIVTVTDNLGCTAEESVEVFAFTCIGEVGAIWTDISCNGACDGVISSFIQFGGVGPFAFVWDNGDTTNVTENLCPGTYSVTITDLGQGGCEFIGAFTITEPEILAAIVDDVVHITDTTVAAISISVSGGTPDYTYLWRGPNGFTASTEDVVDLEEGWYEVRITDTNNCTVSIDSIEVRNEIVSTSSPEYLEVRIYPNPAHQQVFVDLADITDYTIELVGLDGRLMAVWKNTQTLDISTFDQGLYLIKCRSGEKFFIQRLSIVK